MIVHCMICGRGRAHEWPDATRVTQAPPGHAVRLCPDCGLAFLWPPFSPADKAAIYGAHYYDAYAAGAGMVGGTDGVARHLVDRLRRVEARTGPQRMLDIGCARGFLLACAESRGWQADGIEHSPAAVEAQGRLARGRVFRGPVEAATFEPGSFAFVHLNHVLEHLDDPIGTLRRVREWLSPNGVAVIEVPNEFANLYFLLGRALLPHRLRVNPVPTSHQFFFAPATLRRAISQAGLHVDTLRTLRRAFGANDRFALLPWLKRLVYWFEKPFDLAGMIEVWASREASMPEPPR